MNRIASLKKEVFIEVWSDFFLRYSKRDRDLKNAEGEDKGDKEETNMVETSISIDALVNASSQ